VLSWLRSRAGSARAPGKLRRDAVHNRGSKYSSTKQEEQQYACVRWTLCAVQRSRTGAVYGAVRESVLYIQAVHTQRRRCGGC
jgi:hypothetical protein